ncbi:MAG TPA: prepilin-type N-terminal cleavage/methylation domain-containing protein [Solirubrobacterales bacterium]|nr:prepilin-type N-terminal cleavage/methylation domain-containing protein [Solirubrobacterales bacterium]
MEREEGFTLIEMLVAMTMGVVVMGGVMILLIGAMRSQPKLDSQATNIQTARWVLERMTREIRDGVVVDKATASSVSFQTYVRHSTCGSSTTLASSASAIKCEVTYSCSGEACTRLETAPGVYTGTAQTLFTGLSNPAEVFCFVPSNKEEEPSRCGEAKAAASTTYVGIKLEIPDSEGSGGLKAEDGASLRNAILSN